MGIFSSNSDANFDANDILGPTAARFFEKIADDTFMARAFSNTGPKKVRQDTIALNGIIGDNSVSAYGDPKQGYAGTLQPALGAAHDQIVVAQLQNEEEGVATLMTYSLVDGTLVYGLTLVQDVPLLGRFRGGKKAIKAGDLLNKVGTDANLAEVLDYGHMPTHFPSTRHTLLRDRMVQQGVMLVGDSLRWKAAGRDVNVNGTFAADGLDMGSKTNARGCAEVMAQLRGLGYYNTFGALIGEVNARFRRDLINSIGWSGLVGNPDWMDEAKLRQANAELAKMGTEDLLSWYMEQQGLASSVDQDLLLSRSAAPADIAVVAGQLSGLVQQASVLVTGTVQMPLQD